MKVKTLKKIIKDLPDNYEVDFKMTFTFEGEEDVVMISIDSKEFQKRTK